jgi:succinate-semialdehyde dehydrogenase/glutarate-semialdehyde dehydrogenase
VAAAKAAAPGWAARSAYERGALVRKLHDAMGKNVDGLAALLTLECGKPFDEARGEIAYAMSFLDWFAEEGKRHAGDVLPPARGDRRMLTMRSPVGVAALLTPWNFSSAMVARKLAPALVAGCTVVARPSANTPLSALAIVQLAADVGFPPGVINLVVGACVGGGGGRRTAGWCE